MIGPNHVCHPLILSCRLQGDTFYNVDKREKVKIPRLVRMHSDKMEDIEQVR